MVSVEGSFDVDVNHSAAYSLVSEQLLDVKDILRVMVFHRGFPVPNGCERHFDEPRIVELPRYAFAFQFHMFL